MHPRNWMVGLLLWGALSGLASAANVVMIDPTTGLIDIEVKEDLHFVKPASTNVPPWHIMRIRLTSAKPFALTWADPPFKAPFGPMLGALPSTTTGGVVDQFAFQWNPQTATWEYLATTQATRPSEEESKRAKPRPR